MNVRDHREQKWLTLESGWGKKMSYCIAFSADGATDVTRRYVRDPTVHGLDRNRAPEEVLLYITNEIRSLRRSALSKEEKLRLIQEDEREDRELRSYVVSTLAATIERLIPMGESTRTTIGSNSEIKQLPARQTGTEAWRAARGENGLGEQGPDPASREGH